jgi:hypothetical protein
MQSQLIFVVFFHARESLLANAEGDIFSHLGAIESR